MMYMFFFSDRHGLDVKRYFGSYYLMLPLVLYFCSWYRFLAGTYVLDLFETIIGDVHVFFYSDRLGLDIKSIWQLLLDASAGSYFLAYTYFFSWYRSS